MAMIPIDYRGFCRDLCSLAEEGTVPMERIDEAVRRILKLKFELGLFERPNTLPCRLSPLRLRRAPAGLLRGCSPRRSRS